MAISKIILNGVTQMDVTQDTVASNNLLYGETATGADGEQVTGNITTKTSSDLTSSGATVTAPAGYYAQAATYAISSGTEGTPTATKGTVSNNSITVTPSVTNTAGYIAGGTHNGTGVTVSANELVSGSLNIDDDGTYDVTNYASAAVAIDYASKTRAVTFTITRQDTTLAFPFNVYGSFTSLDFSEGIKAAQKLVSLSPGESTGSFTVYIPKNRPVILLGCASTAGNYDVTIDSSYGECIDVPHILGSSNTHITKAIYVKSGAPDSISIGITPYSQASYPETVVLDTLSVSSNGTYTPTSGTAYSSVTVAVSSTQPSLQSKSATPTESSQTITADQGYDGLSSVSVGAISNTYIGSGIARRTASDIYGVYDYGEYSVNVPKGYYDASYYKSVPNGTAGTPTAAKGTVSNHSVTVTPSVTNTAGYITGGTNTGTGVSVSASELVSGSETKTANGTYDVTNLASLVVNIPFVTYYTGTTAPSNSQGSNGDLYLQTEE